MIVGAGALTMPKAFAQTGWILGLVAIGILAIMRFVSAFLICLLLSLYKREIGFQLRIRVSYVTYLFFFFKQKIKEGFQLIA